MSQFSQLMYKINLKYDIILKSQLHYPETLRVNNFVDIELPKI